MHLAAGLSVGLSGVAAGYTIGVVGDAVRIPIPQALPGEHSANTVLRVFEHTCNSHAFTSV